MYGVDGHAVPAEVLLDNLYGYRGSRPVRIGNGAASQTQRDAEGYTLDAVVLCLERLPRPVRPELWNLLRQLADRVESRLARVGTTDPGRYVANRGISCTPSYTAGLLWIVHCG